MLDQRQCSCVGPVSCPVCQPQAARAATTLDIIDELRRNVEDKEYPPLSALFELAADHLDDLATQLCTAEDDIARLNDEVATYAANMATIREWVDWIAVESASGETSSGPRALLDAYPGITLVEPRLSEEEEPTTHE